MPISEPDQMALDPLWDSEGGTVAPLISPVMPAGLYRALDRSQGRQSEAVDAGAEALAACECLSGLSVLLVDDDLVGLLVTEAMLRQAGVHVRVARDGPEAVAAYSETAFDVVITDLHLPSLSGIEVARAIRWLESAQNGNCAILALSASISESDRERCADAGMDDFLCKPVTPQKLYDVLRHQSRVLRERCRADEPSTTITLPPKPCCLAGATLSRQPDLR